MALALSILAVWAVALLLLLLAGYGIGRWLTPPSLRPYELWLTPLWGYGLLIVIAYYGLVTVLTLTTDLIVALLVALLLALWRLRPARMRRDRDAVAADRWPRAPLGETLLVAALGLVAGGLGVVPLLRAGYLLPIGHGWDIEFYLPLAAYLRDYSYADLSSAPVAPLLNVILAEPTSVRAIGFSYVHGMIDLLGGWSPVGTFAILLAFFRALSVVPVYLLLRIGLRARVAGAALGTLLVAANELLLWISYNNFAMHVSSMPLIPLAVLLTLLVLQPSNADRRGAEQAAPQRSHWDLRAAVRDPALLGAIAATTMLTLSYHPALLAYGALAAGLGLWALLVNRDKPATIVRGLLIIAGCLALGWLAHWRAPRAFFDVYAAQTPSIGGERFARLTELAGVETFHHLGLALDQPGWLTAAGWLALVGLIFGIGAALWRGAHDAALWRGPALGLLLFALLYALGLRFAIAFPYGFYKGVSYLSFVPLGIAGVGLAELCAGARLRPRIGRALVLASGAALTTLVLGLTGWSTYRLLATYRAPVLASGDVAAFTGALSNVPDGGVVKLIDHPELRGPALGIASMGLYGHSWTGRGQTGFAVFNQSAPGTGAAYGLMHVSEDPRAWGFAPDDVVARGGGMVLYRAPQGSRAFLSGTAAAYTRAGGSLRQRLDSLQVQDLTHGDFELAEPSAPLTVYASNQRLSWTPLDLTGALQPRVLTLDLASRAAQNVTLAWDGGQQSYAVPQGVSRVTTPPLTGQSTEVTIAPDAATLAVRGAQLFDPNGQMAEVQPLSDTLALATATEIDAQSIQTTLLLTAGGPDVARIGLELYEISERTPRRYAGGMLAVRANEPAVLGLDLAQPAATLNGGTVPLTVGELEDGSYFGALWLYQGTTLVRRVPFVRFERRDGQIEAVQSLDANATFARLPQAAQPLSATIGPTQVLGYTLTPQSARPGADLLLSLQWQVIDPAPEPLLVFAQILGADDRKYAAWDGAAGGDWWPSPAWQPGDRIWQDVPLTLDPATPPGRYRLVIGLYRAADGMRLPVASPQAQTDLIVVQEIEVAP